MMVDIYEMWTSMKLCLNVMKWRRAISDDIIKTY